MSDVKGTKYQKNNNQNDQDDLNLIIYDIIFNKNYKIYITNDINELDLIKELYNKKNELPKFIELQFINSNIIFIIRKINNIFRTVTFTKDKKYRLQISLYWNLNLEHMNFIMETPATADEYNNDSGFTSALYYAKKFECGSFTITTIYPKLPDNIKQLNIDYNKKYIEYTNYIVYCYGSNYNEPEWLKELTKDKEPLIIKKNDNGTPGKITRINRLIYDKLIYFRD